MTTKKHLPWLKTLIAACLCLALLGGGGSYYQSSMAVASIVSLDVNPSIEIEVNKKEQVLDCLPLNTEAQTVLADMDGGKDLKGAKLDVAVNAIIGALVKNGYLESISSAILISVEDDDMQRAARLQQHLTATVDDVLHERAAEASVLSQTVAKDAALEKKAKENSISTGKAALIEQVQQQNSELSFDTLAALSVEELKDMRESGSPALPIGKQAALEAAMAHTGLSNADVLHSEVDAELDERPAHYDVELMTAAGEYEYVVDAYSGKVLHGDLEDRYDDWDDRYDDDWDDDDWDDDDWDDDRVTVPQSSGDIGSDAAKAAALKHAGLSAGDIHSLQIERDYDDGRLEYEVEFKSGRYEYEYTIGGSSGVVLEHEKDYDD